MPDLTLLIPTLETERLRLRSLRVSDLDDYAALYADREVLRYLAGGPEPWDRGRSWRHMAFLMGHWQLGGVGMWAVEHRESGAFVGMIGFAAPDGWPGFELAWTLARRWWGHGYATEGARAALAHAFTALEKDRVISLIHPENRASIRVAERIGEILQGRINHLGRERLCYGLDRQTYVAGLAGGGRPTGELSGPTGGLSGPTGELNGPTGGLNHPTSELSHPTGELNRPTGGLNRPTGELSRPTGGLSRSTGGLNRPTGERARGHSESRAEITRRVAVSRANT